VAALGSSAAPAAAPPTLARLVGQSIMTAFSGTDPDAGLLRRIRAGDIGGVILFGDNVSSPAAVRSLVGRLQATARAGGNPPLLVATDQEGGAVRRLPNGPPRLSERELGGLGSVANARAAGLATAAYLRPLGIVIDLAPVLDTTGPAGNFLGTRVYSDNAGLNAKLGAAFVDGLQQGRVAATAKHFPGLGLAAANTDTNHVYITSERNALDEGLTPFSAAVANGVKLVMVSNAGYRAYDPTGVPAVLSRRIVSGLLRTTLGFHGVVISDALSAPGPSSRPDAAVTALNAGVDVLLYTSESGGAAAFTQLLHAAADGSLSRRTLEQADARIAALKKWLR
jgi:beta-N-acetylhexosaminidase